MITMKKKNETKRNSNNKNMLKKSRTRFARKWSRKERNNNKKN